MQMITVEELFDDLSFGELSNLKVGNSTLASVAEENYPRMISHINLGLLDLYQRFVLKKKELNIHQIAGTTDYYLRTEYMDDAAYCGSNGMYIARKEIDPFTDDIVKVLEVFDATGAVIPLNDRNATARRVSQGSEVTPGITTPAHDTLIMVLPPVPEIVTVSYQARYPKITITELFDPKKIKLYIPDFIRKPLMFFIAARIVAGIKVSLSEGENHPATSLRSGYNAACNEITNLNLTIDEDSTSDQFENSNLP